MAGRTASLTPLLLGIVVPLLLIVTNTLWNYAGILLTIIALVWIGFALILLTPSGTA